MALKKSEAGQAGIDRRKKRGEEQAQVPSHLGGGHVSFNCVVMEVSAYMVSCQSATLGRPNQPHSLQGSTTKCRMSVKEMESDGGRG